MTVACQPPAIIDQDDGDKLVHRFAFAADELFDLREVMRMHGWEAAGEPFYTWRRSRLVVGRAVKPASR